MSDAFIDPRGWQLYDLHSLYAACIEHFAVHGIPWYAQPWGEEFFANFDHFLSAGWPAITITDVKTGRSHVATYSSAFYNFVSDTTVKFEEPLPLPRIMPDVITPFETTLRPKYVIKDLVAYEAVYATLPALQLEAQIARARKGEPIVVQDLWAMKDRTFLAIDFEWWEKNPSTILEWGFAVVQCGQHRQARTWPPRPEEHYRRAHYIIGDHLDRKFNRYQPTYPRAYAFGESLFIAEAYLPQAIQALISSLASPDSETTPNRLVLVGHGIHGDLSRLREMAIDIPRNVVIVDTASFERKLFVSGQGDPRARATLTGEPRAMGRTFSLADVLRSLGVAVQCKSHNAGNDAMLSLLAFQLLLEPDTALPMPLKPVGLH